METRKRERERERVAETETSAKKGVPAFDRKLTQRPVLMYFRPVTAIKSHKFAVSALHFFRIPFPVRYKTPSSRFPFAFKLTARKDVVENFIIVINVFVLLSAQH